MRALPSSVEKTYTVFECSEILGISTIAIRRWIRRRELPAHKFKKNWVVKVSDLRDFQLKLGEK